MTVRSKWARSVGKINKDELGRWTRTTLTTEHFRLAVYKVYVPSGTSLGGPATVRRQLQHSVDRRGGTPSWQEQLYHDLLLELQRDNSLGYEVVLGGDFNESLEKGNMMKRLLTEQGLINLLQKRINPVPATRKGSKLAIDHVWFSRGVIDRVSTVGIVLRDTVFLSEKKN